MPFNVVLTKAAARDVEELYDYIARHDTPEKAAHVLNKIEAVVAGLSTSPNRGAFPKELLELGIREYREIFFKPYRVLYRIVDTRVCVLLVVDDRRDMQSLLHRRLFED